MNIKVPLTKYAKWLDTTGDLVDGLDIKSGSRYRIAASLFHLGIEHSGSIYHLLLKEHYGSSFALLRPQLEAYIRGAWFNLCASEAQIEAYKNNKEPPKINDLIKALEATDQYDDNSLKEIKQKAWGMLCAYTHGGYYQVAYRNTETEINSDYDEEYVINLIDQSCSITLLTIAGIAALIESKDLASNALSFYNKIFSDNPA